MSFWGSAQLPPDSEIGRFVAAISSATKGKSRAKKLELMTTGITALVMYVADNHGPREALAIIDTLHNKIIERASL